MASPTGAKLANIVAIKNEHIIKLYLYVILWEGLWYINWAYYWVFLAVLLVINLLNLLPISIGFINQNNSDIKKSTNKSKTILLIVELATKEPDINVF